MQRNKAFTLIELLIVVAIIAILAAIAVPNFLEAQVRAKVSRVKSDQRTVAVALESYYVDSNNFPPANPNPAWSADPRGYVGVMWQEGTFSRWKNTALTTPIAYLSGRPPIDPFGISGTTDEDAGVLKTNVGFYYHNLLGGVKAAQGNPGSWPGASPSIMERPVPVAVNGAVGSDPKTYPSNWMLISPGPDRSFTSGSPDDNTDVDIRWSLHADWAYANLIGANGKSMLIYDPSNGTVSNGVIARLSGASEF